MAVLVTGASGFVGSAVARKLIERGDEVRLMTRPTSDRRNLEGLKAAMLEGDLRDRDSLRRCLEGCSQLYHVAADYRLWTRDPGELYASNVDGTRHIIEAAIDAGVEKVVYTSSVAVLGHYRDGSSATEDMPVTLGDMIGHYKRSKFLAEREVDRLVAEKDAPVVIVNPSAPIGPGDVKPTPTGRIIVDTARGKMPAFVDTGLNVVHVDDVATGHLLAAERGIVGERYILGGENMTLEQILNEVCRLTGRRPPRLRLPHNLVMPLAHIAESWARIFNTREPRITVDGVRMARYLMYYSCDKAREKLGYVPRPAVQAIADAVGWFRASGYLD